MEQGWGKGGPKSGRKNGQVALSITGGGRACTLWQRQGQGRIKGLDTGRGSDRGAATATKRKQENCRAGEGACGAQ